MVRPEKAASVLEYSGTGGTPDAGTGSWGNGPDILPDGRCKFNVAPPRHFLYPALLLLVAEEPRHGYTLAEALTGLGLGKIDRPSVYRGLGDLEADNLVASTDARPTAGSVRHVYSITARGAEVLETWMAVVSQERECLDLVLRRYWYCNAHLLPELAGAGAGNSAQARAGEPGLPSELALVPPMAARDRQDEEPDGTGATSCSRARFEVVSDTSAIVVEARSNVGPIAFTTSSIAGWVEANLLSGLVQEEPAPSSHLEIDVRSLTSGNGLFDSELLRRVDARRFPQVILDLDSLSRLGEGNCYLLSGDATIHGVTCRLGGSITATAVARPSAAHRSVTAVKRRLIVTGEYVLDIRQFGMEMPRMPLLKIYPDVRLHLRLEAEAAI